MPPRDTPAESWSPLLLLVAGTTGGLGGSRAAACRDGEHGAGAGRAARPPRWPRWPAEARPPGVPGGDDLADPTPRPPPTRVTAEAPARRRPHLHFEKSPSQSPKGALTLILKVV